MKTRILLSSLCFVLSASFSGCASFEPVSYGGVVTKQLSMEEVHSVLIASAISQKWTIVDAKIGDIRATKSGQVIRIHYNVKETTVTHESGSNKAHIWAADLNTCIAANMEKMYPEITGAHVKRIPGARDGVDRKDVQFDNGQVYKLPSDTGLKK